MKVKLLCCSVLLLAFLLPKTSGAFALSDSTAKAAVDTAKGMKAHKTPKPEKLKELPDPASISWKKNLAIAQKLDEQGSIYNALKYYEGAVNKNPTKTDIYHSLADGNFKLRDYKSANKYYKMLVDLDSAKHQDFVDMYYYALTDKYMGNYEKAKLNFELLNRYPNDNHQYDNLLKLAARESKGCDLGIQYRDDKTYHEIKLTHLDNNINQPFTDYSPVLRDPNTLYYGSWVSDKVILTGKREKYATFSRIYVSKRSGNTWNKSELAAGDVNTVAAHVGNETFAADGKTMYYTQCLQDEHSLMRCNIYKSLLGDSGWIAGVPLDDKVNEPGATNTEPALGKNENGEMVLYFASDRNKDHGMDLYYAKINTDGSFEKARLVSGPVNTDGDEMSPFYDFQTNTLYFSSNGHINIGGMDVFKTKATNGTWSEPENMGVPINSSVDDMYFNWNEHEGLGFVVSNRPGGFGLKSETCCDDIYQLYIHKIYLAVKGTIVNSDTTTQLMKHQPVTLYDADNNTPIKTYNAVNGTYFFDLKPDKNYKLSAMKDSFFTATQTFNTIGKENSDTLSFTLGLKRFEKNKAYALGNVYYEYDKFDLTPASKVVLDTLYDLMKENPALVIELSSHTDGKGADKYNMDLSQKRAESCVEYVVGRGIDKDRIVAKGYGKTMPIAPNTKPDGSDNPEGRAKNRRTEFKIIDVKTTPAPATGTNGTN